MKLGVALILSLSIVAQNSIAEDALERMRVIDNYENLRANLENLSPTKNSCNPPRVSKQIGRSSKPDPDLFKNMTYECPDKAFAFMDMLDPKAKVNQEKKAHYIESMRLYFENVVFTGIERLKSIRPDLAQKAVDRLKEKMTVSCETAKKTPVAESQGRKIRLGSSAFVVYQYDETRRSEDVDLIQKMENERAFGGPFNLAVVFHEFLHIARFDNLKTKEHNNLGDDPPYHFDRDIVYACTESVYRVPERWFPKDSDHAIAIESCKKLNPKTRPDRFIKLNRPR